MFRQDFGNLNIANLSMCFSTYTVPLTGTKLPAVAVCLEKMHRAYSKGALYLELVHIDVLLIKE